MKTKIIWFILYILVICTAWLLLSPGLEYFKIDTPFTTLTPFELILYGMHIHRTDLTDVVMITLEILSIPLCFFAILGMDKKLGAKGTDIRIFIWAGLTLLMLGVWACMTINPPTNEEAYSSADIYIRILQQEAIAEHVMILTVIAGIFLAVIGFPKARGKLKAQGSRGV